MVMVERAPYDQLVPRESIEALQSQVQSLRRWLGALAVAVALLAIAALRPIASAVAQPAPPPPAKTLSFVDGDKQIDLDATGLRITRGAAHMSIAADKLTAVSGDGTVELSAASAETHVKALSDLGSTSLVATPKSLCVAIRQIGGKDSYTCIPPIK
jgi:hypothetical protein